jgi:hypothetical protein
MKRISVVVLLAALSFTSCAEEPARGVPKNTAKPTHPAPAPAAPIAHENPQVSDVPPSWYQGAKLWSEIGLEGREQLIRMRAAYEAQQATAQQAGSGSDDKAVAAGRALIDRIVQRYRLADVYKEPDTFGPRMVIWLPEVAWARLSSAEKESIEAYMSSRYTNWGIGTGRIRGEDVLYDNLVVEH